MIQFRCSGCNKQYKVIDEMAGRGVRCKTCGTTMKIPAPVLAEPLTEGMPGGDLPMEHAGAALSASPVSTGGSPGAAGGVSLDAIAALGQGGQAGQLAAAPEKPRPAKKKAHAQAAPQIDQDAYAFACDQMNQGVSARQTQVMLVERGVDEASANQLVSQLVHQQQQNQALARASAHSGYEGGGGGGDFLIGGLWCFGGIAVTVGTYMSAAPGGTYVVAWGAIIFGGIQMLKGLFT